MIPSLVAVGALMLGFVLGAMWEGCRKGGTLDLQLQAAMRKPFDEPSNVRRIR